MSTLDNLHTGNRPERWYPTTRARNAYLQQALYSNRTWDPANEGPVAPVADYNPLARTSSHLSPQLEERLTTRGMKDYLVPTQPRTLFRYGDTASGVLLMEDGKTPSNSWWTRLLDGTSRARLPTNSRFAPYQR